MACEELYATVAIENVVMPSNLGSDRGTQVHDVMAQYIRHCVARRIPSDWAALDRFALDKNAQARQILQGLRSEYVVNWAGSRGAELTLSLDSQFQPVVLGAVEAYSELRMQVTLDHLITADGIGEIEDFKTHPAPFEADTIQSKLYPLVAFQHYADLEEITFKLIFVRYRKCARTVHYTRQDVPELIDYVQGFLERQMDIHRREARESSTHRLLNVIPGPHCQYCPHLVQNSCPIGDFNEHVTHRPEEWLKFVIWSRQVQSRAKEVLKAYVGAHEKGVTVTDGNGETSEFNAWPSVSLEYPLRPTYEKLEEWRKATGEDLRPKLTVGATQLRAILKSRRRADLADELANVADPVSGSTWGVKVGKKEPIGEEDGA